MIADTDEPFPIEPKIEIDVAEDPEISPLSYCQCTDTVSGVAHANSC